MTVPKLRGMRPAVAGAVICVWALAGCGGSTARTATLVPSAPAGWNTALFAFSHLDVYLSLPPQWTQEPQRVTDGTFYYQIVPDGSPGTVGASGVPIAGTTTSAYPTGLVLFGAHPTSTLLAAAQGRLTSLRGAHARNVRSQIVPVAIPGAVRAYRVHDTFTTADGGRASDDALFIAPRSGGRLVVIVGTVAGSDHPLPPTTITGSLRLRNVAGLD